MLIFHRTITLLQMLFAFTLMFGFLRVNSEEVPSAVNCGTTGEAGDVNVSNHHASEPITEPEPTPISETQANNTSNPPNNTDCESVGGASTQENTTIATLKLTNAKTSTNSSLKPTYAETSTNSTLKPTDAETSTNSTLKPTNPESSTNSTVKPTNHESSTNTTLKPTNPESSTNSTLNFTNPESSTNSTLKPTNPESSTNSTFKLTNAKTSTNSTLKPTNDESTNSTLKPTNDESTNITRKPTNDESTNSTLKPTNDESTNSTLKPTNAESSTNSTLKPINTKSMNSTLKPTNNESSTNTSLNPVNIEIPTNSILKPINSETSTDTTLKPSNPETSTNITLKPLKFETTTKLTPIKLVLINTNTTDKPATNTTKLASQIHISNNSESNQTTTAEVKNITGDMTNREGKSLDLNQMASENPHHVNKTSKVIATNLTNHDKQNSTTMKMAIPELEMSPMEKKNTTLTTESGKSAKSDQTHSAVVNGTTANTTMDPATETTTQPNSVSNSFEINRIYILGTFFFFYFEKFQLQDFAV